MKQINFGELRIGETAKNNLLDCVNTDWASSGPKVKEFERKWGELFDYKYNKAVSSGTDAVLNLVSSLYALGAKRGDEVIVPALSFIATSNAVLMAGFTPVFVDVELDTMNLNPAKVEAAITDKTRAILVVHTMGRPCDMTAFNEIATRRELYLFEDACEAHGAKILGEYIGKWSHGAAFSFYTAHLINSGEGGMVSTQVKEVADAVGCTRSHGREEGSLYFDHIMVGYNSKMNDLEASLGLEGISNFQSIFDYRRGFLIQLIMATQKYKEFAWFSFETPEFTTCPHGFSITLKDNRNINLLTEVLDSNKIQWKRNFGSIPTQHKAYEFMGHKVGDFPNAEYIGDFGIHIGTHHYMQQEDVDRIIDVLSTYFEALQCQNENTSQLSQS